MSSWYVICGHGHFIEPVYSLTKQEMGVSNDITMLSVPVADGIPMPAIKMLAN
jgi:hypothetical protein